MSAVTDTEPLGRRQEIIARLMLCVQHPFGGFGQPKGEELATLCAELLLIPGDGPQAANRTRRGWTQDDENALRALAHCGADLDQTAEMLGRGPKATYSRCTVARWKTPPDWHAIYRDILAMEQGEA